MNKKILIVISLILIGLLAWFLLGHKRDNDTPEDQLAKASTIEEAWIEINSGAVFLKNVGQGVELKNGDPLKQGVSIETGRNAEATIHFPDGSLIRLDKETSIKIDDIFFRRNDGFLNAKTTLAFGRVWVKATGLINESSNFEIKTANIFAETKNGAYGIGYKNGHSTVIVNENNVVVTPIDPISKEKITYAQVTVPFGNMIEIGSAQIKEATAATIPGAFNNKLTSISSIFTTDQWIQAMKKADETINQEILVFKENHTNKEALDESVKREREKQLSYQPGLRTEAPTYASNNNRNINISSIADNGSSLSGSLSVEMASEGLGGIGNVVEGDEIEFKAILTDGGGNKKDVSDFVLWSTTGQIGTVTSSGLFRAKLGAEVSELGKTSGFVVAELKDSAGSSSNVRVTSDLINVKAAISAGTDSIGGQ